MFTKNSTFFAQQCTFYPFCRHKFLPNDASGGHLGRHLGCNNPRDVSQNPVCVMQE